MKQQAHSPRGRRVSARGREPGPPCAPREEEGRPRDSLKGQPAPPNCKLAASAQVLGSRRPPAGRPGQGLWPVKAAGPRPGPLSRGSWRAREARPGARAGLARPYLGNRCGDGPHSCRPERRGAPRKTQTVAAGLCGRTGDTRRLREARGKGDGAGLRLPEPLRRRQRRRAD